MHLTREDELLRQEHPAPRAFGTAGLGIPGEALLTVGSLIVLVVGLGVGLALHNSPEPWVGDLAA